MEWITKGSELEDILTIDVDENIDWVHWMMKFITDKDNENLELKSCIFVNAYIWLSYVILYNAKSHVYVFP